MSRTEIKSVKCIQTIFFDIIEYFEISVYEISCIIILIFLLYNYFFIIIIIILIIIIIIIIQAIFIASIRNSSYL